MQYLITTVNTEKGSSYEHGFVEFIPAAGVFFVLTEEGFCAGDFSAVQHYRCPYEGILYDNYHLLACVIL